MMRHDPHALEAELGQPFRLEESVEETHRTPLGTTQKFWYSRFPRGVCQHQASILRRRRGSEDPGGAYKKPHYQCEKQGHRRAQEGKAIILSCRPGQEKTNDPDERGKCRDRQDGFHGASATGATSLRHRAVAVGSAADCGGSTTSSCEPSDVGRRGASLPRPRIS